MVRVMGCNRCGLAGADDGGSSAPAWATFGGGVPLVIAIVGGVFLLAWAMAPGSR